MAQKKYESERRLDQKLLNSKFPCGADPHFMNRKYKIPDDVAWSVPQQMQDIFQEDIARETKEFIFEHRLQEDHDLQKKIRELPVGWYGFHRQYEIPYDVAKSVFEQLKQLDNAKQFLPTKCLTTIGVDQSVYIFKSFSYTALNALVTSLKN